MANRLQRWLGRTFLGIRAEATSAEVLGRLGAVDLAEWAGWDTSTGIRVTRDQALRVGAVFACVRVIAEGVAQLPFRLMRRAGADVREPVDDHRLARLLRRPNDWQTGFDFRETLTMHAALAGNGYAYIVRYPNTPAGEPRELIPMMPNQAVPRMRADGRLVYRLSAFRDLGEVDRAFVLHLRGPSWDPVVGLDCVALARQALGLAIATETAQTKLHTNGGRVPLVFTSELTLGKEKLEELGEYWKQTHGGAANAYRTAFVDGGMEPHQISLSALDSQTADARRFQIEEVCRFFRVFPQMVMQADKASTYASAEQFFLAHAVHTLQPWAERLEQTFDRDLLPPGEDRLYHYLEMNALMRAAARDRAEFYRVLWSAGAMNANEIRAREDMNPYPGGDQYRAPVNTAPVDAVPPADPPPQSKDSQP